MPKPRGANPHKFFAGAHPSALEGASVVLARNGRCPSCGSRSLVQEQPWWTNDDVLCDAQCNAKGCGAAFRFRFQVSKVEVV